MAPSSPAPSAPEPRVADDDDEYDYYWSPGGLDIRVPRWLAEILDVPLAVRLEIFLVGVCAGLIMGAIAVLVAFYTAI